jgi:hypothetical protein
MISESLEILGFSLGLILVLYLRKVQKRPQKEEPQYVQTIPIEEPLESPVITSSIILLHEEE